MPSVQQIRTLLQAAPNRQVAMFLGCSIGKVQRWRAALHICPYPRGTRGPGSTEQALLNALQPPGTWHRKAHLAALRAYDVTYALQALQRKGLVQRRGAPGWYEYALTEGVH